MSNLTDAQLRALAYYAVGVASEGKDVAYELRIAANTSTGPNGERLLQPIGNSGYTVGEMQTDLGARPKAAQDLVHRFQVWARARHPDWVMSTAQEEHAATELGRDGNKIRDPDYVAHDEAYQKTHHNQHIPSFLLPDKGSDIEPVLKERLNKYLASDEGKSFVHVLDVAQVEDLKKNVGKRLQVTPLYKQSSLEDQAKLFGMVAKAYNQGPLQAGKILTGIENKSLTSLDDVHKRIGTLADYMRTGRDHALDGVKVFNALSSASEKNSIHAPWQAV
ncbi:MAG: hypothetical protein JSS56_24735, partial [Proteobacteria bacterium]|nr:hypothetical protein [Pseudomonadota bacterium]